MRPMFNVVFSLLAIATVAAPAEAAIKWSGGAGVRFMRRSLDDGLETKNAAGKDSSTTINRRWEYRGALGASETGELVDWTIALRTYSSQTSEWVSNTSSGDITIGLEQANARIHGKEWTDGEYAITIGRQKNAIAYDSVAQAFLDRDTRWDGFGWNWKKEGFGLNLAQYILGGVSQGTRGASVISYTDATQNTAASRSAFSVLYSFQPTYTVKFSDEIQALFAVGYHVWNNTSGGTTATYQNTVHGGNTVASDAAPTTVIVDNSRQWQFLTDWNLPYNLRFVGEFIHNKRMRYGTLANPTGRNADRNAYAASLVYGVAKKAHEWNLAYSYSNKGIGSVVGTFTNGDAPADNVSHMFEGKYMLADSVTFGAKYQMHKEKSKVDGNGLALTSPNEKRMEKVKRLELYTTVAF